ncbi:MAG: DUF2156 domain-containing protein [Myxococcaceae bacterium]|nr:DUF2156 domain-containing protein [Myxococcaceae bacterium]
MRAELFRAHGVDPISYSTLQPGLQYFDTSYGYVAYARAAGFALTLGPPVCAPADRGALISAFYRAVRRPVFFYVLHDVAQLAKDLGGVRYGICPIGIDKVISLEQRVDADAKVKSAVKKAKKAGLRLTEVKPSQADRARLENINAAYLQKSAVSVEMKFLNRPLSYVDDGLAQLFLLQLGGETLGYAAVDPYFERGAAKGWLLNLLRFGKTSLWGVYYSAVAMLAERLAATGARELSLGFCPLAELDAAGCSPLLSAQARWLAKRFAEVPYLARLREMKSAFPGAMPQRYFVGASPLVATTVLSLLRACGVPLAPLLTARPSHPG